MMTDEEEQNVRAALKAHERLLRDQREANERMVEATIRADELAEKAEAAQRRAEDAARELRDSEERYRTLFELSPMAVYSCDAAGVIQAFNRNAVELWGRAPNAGDTDARFCGSLKLFRPDGSDLAHELCPMADVLAGRVAEVRDAEVGIERPDGSRITVVVNIRPLKDRQGEVMGAINCFHDITGRKHAEEQLTDSLNRERELAEFRELFIGIVGHDLRNPLSSIVTAAALLLRRGNGNEQDAETAARIIRSSQRMTRMITQLLDLTRARLGGGLSIEPQPTDLSQICRDVVVEFDAPIRLEATEGLTGTWDRDRLAQVLSNIVGNAVTHAAKGTAVAVKARAEEAEVVVEVSNRGDPIPADLLPFIFEPFRRRRRREKSASGNLGLGLFIAHQIVVAHGGTLDAHCDGGTTTFRFRLPRRPPAGSSRLSSRPA